MPIAEGKIFHIADETAIRPDFLETIEYPGQKQEITYETDEFSAVCPFSGLPDIAKLTIKYIPKKHIPELKALKYYLMSYRDVGIYQEKATDRIFKDIFAMLKPEWLEITTIYNIRGGILATCVMDSNKL